MEGQPSALASFIETIARTPIPTIVLTMVIATVIRLGALFGVAQTDGIGQRTLQILADLADAVIYAGILVFMVVRPFVLQTFWIPSESMEQTLLKGDYLIVNKAIYRTRDPMAGEIVVFRAPAEALNPGQEEGKTDFIKRCIGVPGMTIECRVDPDGKQYLYRNGKKVEEPYLGSEIEQEFKLVKLDKSYLSEAELEELRTNRLARPDSPDYVVLQREPGVSTDTPGNGVSINNHSLEVFGDLGNRLWARPAAPLPDNCYLMMGDNRKYSSDGRFWGMTQRWRVVGRADVVFFPPTRWKLAR